VTTPLVSAICLTRNRPAFIRRAIELFMAQTYPNKEMVIVDDGRSPASFAQGLPPQVRHVLVDRPLSFEHAQCVGFSVAKGEYLCTWDDDDWNGPERLALEARELIEGRADVVGCETILLMLPNMEFRKWSAEQIQVWHTAGGSWLPFHDGTAMWRASLTTGFKRVGRDYDMRHLKYMQKAGARFKAIPNDGLFVYVRHPGAEWSVDFRAMTDPIGRPTWVTDEMVAFWRTVA
jgi:glycosyltransferase involved in cell wall biosynthesis